MPNNIFFENDNLLLKSRVLHIKGQNIAAPLSKNQALLVYYLMNKINEKGLLIESIWQEKNNALMDVRYNQLIFKTRRTLYNKGFPSDFILTMKGYGLCLNSVFLDFKEKKIDQYFYEQTEHYIL